MTKPYSQYKQNILFVALSILFILVTIFIIKTISLLKKPTSTMIVRNGEIIKYEEVTGYVIRREELVDTSSYSGIVNTNISDGYRVAKDGVISTYVSNSEKDLIQKISDLDSKIQDVMDSQQEILPNDVKVLESDIKTKLYSVIKRCTFLLFRKSE